ncbi:MAG: DUF3047 domain-containing protein [Pseudomonadota bacterium]
MRHGITGKWTTSVLFFLIMGVPALMLQADAGRFLDVGKFSAASPEEALPSGWEPLTFKKIKKHTAYSLAKDDGVVVVKAESRSSASGLIRKIRIDPKEYPLVAWRWKVTRIYTAGDVSKKEGDDYPARIYIAFEYDPAGLSFLEKAKYGAIKLFYGEYPPVGALTYIWESKAPKGAMVPNPYTDRVVMIVVESGKSRLNTWISEERNILEDYRKAFGKDPSAISGVAIMTDTDNTGESAVSYYGDIVFKKK